MHAMELARYAINPTTPEILIKDVLLEVDMNSGTAKQVPIPKLDSRVKTYVGMPTGA